MIIKSTHPNIFNNLYDLILSHILKALYCENQIVMITTDRDAFINNLHILVQSHNYINVFHRTYKKWSHLYLYFI